MTDLVKRMRAKVPPLGAVVPVDMDTTRDLAMLVDEAASRIEKLEAFLDTLPNAAASYHSENLAGLEGPWVLGYRSARNDISAMLEIRIRALKDKGE